ncbi:MAG TPA: sulfur carrier protein ThiS [Flavobacteriales bacterium]|nr:sulfur carrier protein ThiS [Flavobacteriales bacterium]
MEITINNQLKSLQGETGLSLQQLLDLEIPGKQKGIAVAVNNRVVPKAQWSTTLLSPNDSLLIIKATQGG